MQTYRFGRKITLPATVAIRRQLRMLMAEDIKRTEVEAARKKAEGRKRELSHEREVVGV
jgi:hypothetical protein